MARHSIYGIIAIIILMFYPCTLVADCTHLDGTPNDDAAITTKKAEYAISVISNRAYLAHDRACVEAAIHYLGMNNVAKAIPKLTALLGYSTRDAVFEPNLFKHTQQLMPCPTLGNRRYQRSSA